MLFLLIFYALSLTIRKMLCVPQVQTTLSHLINYSSPTAQRSLEIKPRSVWTPQEPRWSLKLHLPVTSVFMSYTYTSHCFSYRSCIEELRFLEKFSTRIGHCPTVRYNFLVGGDMEVYEGRGWYSRPSLPPKYKVYNKRSIYVGFIGLFKDFAPSDQMYQALEDLVQYGIKNSLIRKKHLSFTIKPAGRSNFLEL